MFTLSLVVGADLILFLVLDSGVIGDPDRLSAGLHANQESVSYARLRSGRYQSYYPQALSLRTSRSSPPMQLAAVDRGFALQGIDGQTLATIPFRMARTLEEFTETMTLVSGEYFQVESFCPEEHQVRSVQGLHQVLQDYPLRLHPGRTATVGWAQEATLWQRFPTGFLSLLRFDFGTDVDGRDIGQRLRERGGRSLALSIPAFLLAMLAALGLAQLAVVLRGRVDRSLQIAAALIMAVTSLAWILFLRRLFLIDLAWFPLRPWSAPVWPLLALPILLWVWLAAWPDFLLYRTILRERLDQGWFLAARSRGVRPWRLWWRHTLPNLAAPLASLLAVTLPYLVMGSLLLERIFDIPGLGDSLLRAIETGDAAFLRAATFLFALAFLGASWLGDFLAAWADPRLRQHSPQEAQA